MMVVESTEKAWPRRIHCTECSSVLQIDPADINGPSRDYTGDSNGDYWVDCGACGHQITISPALKAAADRWASSKTSRSQPLVNLNARLSEQQRHGRP